MSVCSEQIKAFAHQIGFSFCGIARADALENHRKYNEDFIREGHYFPFTYLKTNLEQRLDPSKILPGIKSVIAVLHNYFPNQVIPEENNFIISKYAYGEDYQGVIKKKLNALTTYITSPSNPHLDHTSPPAPLLKERGEGGSSIKALGFVDSGSVLEKLWAQRCGVGWQGKNTLLINKNRGSFFFIGIILTNLELDPDEQESDHCGSCSKCREACPTGALDHPYQLNIPKCISYHTIESKDPVPEEFKGKFKGRIFGCDICQDVCPYNRSLEPSSDPTRTPHPDLLRMRKQDWLELTEEHFKVIFKGTPVYRTGYPRLMENIGFVANEKK